ncbi:LacI family transcriptional regulator [Rubellimicrobium rubrum]|uniref:LacI family transcriptional regulator n=1 Tax=Rubellimicrobium rubrum TaxID=2585369 RepID=A0A5C4N5W2_9RHOB|nr:LacI family DNA-binding transcriptional regulator [Rubellimicrobium rubrum]TNC52344.1 LacI family transcriptional regulator [Rubellimicrobium rubrum]
MTGIRQLASRLDISIGTVSRALNDRPGVNAETRARVLQMADEIGYFANASGRSLRRGSTGAIGVVIETGSPSALGGDNFFFALLDAMQEVLTEQDYDLVLLPTRHAADPLDSFRRMIRRGMVDAIVLTATRRNDPRIELLLGSKVPFLTLGRSETPGDYSWIDLDFERVARTSVDRLVALGHRRIAVVTPTGDANLAFLYADAAVRALAEHGIDGPPDLILRAEPSEGGGVMVARDLLTRPERPTAIMCCSEPMTTGLYSEFLQAGLRIGRDMSVIGFRDNPHCRYLSPAPTCFALALDELGQHVANAIASIAAKDRTAAPRIRTIWPMEFRETASIGPPRSPDRS